MKKFLEKYDAPVAVITPFLIWVLIVVVMYKVPFFHNI